MIKPHLLAIAREFWERAGGRTAFPADIERAVSSTLPLLIISLDGLSIAKIRNWFHQRNIPVEGTFDDRLLHGFISLHQDCGFIFVNGTDSLEERRATVAHELAHYLLDYQRPRQKAVAALGTGILDVLDGYRPPTIEEKVHGLLTPVSIKPFTHLLEKEGDGSFHTYEVWNAENEADWLAMELLAPFEDIRNQFYRNAPLPATYQQCKEQIKTLLQYRYGLPLSFIEDYAGRLALNFTGGRSVKEILGLT